MARLYCWLVRWFSPHSRAQNASRTQCVVIALKAIQARPATSTHMGWMAAWTKWIFIGIRDTIRRKSNEHQFSISVCRRRHFYCCCCCCCCNFHHSLWKDGFFASLVWAHVDPNWFPVFKSIEIARFLAPSIWCNLKIDAYMEYTRVSTQLLSVFVYSVVDFVL